MIFIHDSVCTGMEMCVLMQNIVMQSGSCNRIVLVQTGKLYCDLFYMVDMPLQHRTDNENAASG